MDAVLLAGLPSWVGTVVIVFTILSMPIKGVALYKAAQLSHKKWFVVILLVNTLGILDSIYLYFVASKYNIEVSGDR